MGYGEKNPLVEYKIEGSRLFSVMLGNLKEEIVELLMKVEVRRIEEDIPAMPFQAGAEIHAELDQFGSGGIPTQSSVSRQARADDRHTEGGVKRKKSRRSRR
jgi:preprotein translocase subunit SecA